MNSIPENQRLKNELNMLKAAFMEPLRDSPALILAGRYFLCEYDRDELPDWVAVCAGANERVWGAALEEIRAEIYLSPNPFPEGKGEEEEGGVE